jgi:hypothetical protein
MRNMTFRAKMYTACLIVLFAGGLLTAGLRVAIGTASATAWEPAGTKVGSEERALFLGSSVLDSRFIDPVTSLLYNNTAAYCSQATASGWSCSIVKTDGATSMVHVDDAGAVSIGP